MFNTIPDDPKITEMNPVTKMWMFYNWIEDHNDEYEQLKNQGILIGSFTNPEQAQKMLGTGVSTFKSTDAEFDAFSNKLIEDNRRELEDKSKNNHRRRKKKILD